MQHLKTSGMHQMAADLSRPKAIVLSHYLFKNVVQNSIKNLTRQQYLKRQIFISIINGFVSISFFHIIKVNYKSLRLICRIYIGQQNRKLEHLIKISRNLSGRKK